MIYFIKSERIRTLERTSLKDARKHPEKKRGTFMEKSTLLKIIREARNLEIKMSKNDYYNKKKRRIERKMIEIDSNKEALEYYKQNKETLNFCYGFIGKVENENKAINNQIKQYLTNYILIIFDEISTETNKIHDLSNYYVLYKYELSICLHLDYDKTYIINDYIKYIESHLTKKTITKKFSIDDFKNFIKWDIKTPEQEAQENKQLEVYLDNSKAHY